MIRARCGGGLLAQFGASLLVLLTIVGVRTVSAQIEKPVVISAATDVFRVTNPALLSVANILYARNLIFDGLTKLNERMEAVPDLAESWTVSEDGLTYTFNLREGVKWHDGKPFTAEDVKFTYEVMLHPDNPAGSTHFPYFESILGAPEFRKNKAKSIEGIQMLGPRQIRILLREPYVPFLVTTAAEPIIPKHILGDVPIKTMIQHPFTHKPIGTGPYMLESWKSHDKTVLRANPNYFGKRAAIETFIWQTMPDDFGRLASLRTGTLNVNGLFAAVPVDEFENVKKDPCCRGVRMPGMSNWFLDLNLENPIFQDVRVRQAVSYAIDRKAILKHIFHGWGTIANSPFHPVSWAYKKDVTIYDGDPGKARELLEEAGWKVGPDSIRVKNGKRLSFNWKLAIGRDSAVMAEAALPMLRAVGIEAKLERLDFVTLWFKHYDKKQFDALSHLLPNSLYPDPDYALGRWYNHRTNKTGYYNPKVEDLIKKGARTGNREKRKEIYHELQEVLAKDAVRLWLILPDELWGVSKKLAIPDYPTGYLRILATGQWSWEK